ncbi:MAG: trypsin-like peptidase domain-containing protein, partial [Muribaculaceae bacterium]|nr:trypsin-like peptidase domain-containing protein [Muribaculaceae bacterium]
RSNDVQRRGVIFPSEPLRRFQSADAAPLPGDGAANPPRQSRSALLWFVAILAAAAIGFGVWKIAELSSANRRLDEIVARQAASQTEPQQSSTGNPAADNGGAGRVTSTSSPSPAAGASPSEAAMKEADKSVYYVMALGFEVTTPYGQRYEIKCGNGSGQIPGWSGTGFLLSDGRFVTARHVVEPWYFLDGGDTSREMLSLNILASNGGRVVARFGAVSSTGDQILFSSSDCQTDRSGDQLRRTRSGEIVAVAPTGARDFATVSTGRAGGLPFSPEASRTLSRGTKLTVLSFPLGLGANSYNDINPVYGSATVAADGLQDGMILTTETTYEKGSSGGPVFITDSSGQLVVVGITSAIAGRSTGFIEPISSIH